MANKQLPPGWGNNKSSGKPNWENQKQEPEKEEQEPAQSKDDVSQNEDVPISNEPMQEGDKVEPIDDSTATTSDETDAKNTETTPAETTSDSENPTTPILNDNVQYEKGTSKKSKAPMIVLIVLFVIVVIAFALFVLWHFHEKKVAENTASISVATPINEIAVRATIPATEETTATTITTTTTTTQATTTTVAVTTTKATTAPLAVLPDRTYDAIVGAYSSGINIYSSPYSDHTVIGALVPSETFRVDSYYVDDNDKVWFRLNGDNGWIDGYDDFSCPYLEYFNLIEWSDDLLFTHFDIDKDGTDEWIFQTGTCMADMTYEVYTADSACGIKYLGTIPNGALCEDEKGQLITAYGHMGWEAAYIVTMKANVLSLQLLFEHDNVIEYTTPGTVVESWTRQDVFGSSTSTDYSYDTYAYGSDGVLSDGRGNESDEYDDDYIDEETPNVFCPNCGYGYFETGVGTEGFTCPSCGYNWLP